MENLVCRCWLRMGQVCLANNIVVPLSESMDLKSGRVTLLVYR